MLVTVARKRFGLTENLFSNFFLYKEEITQRDLVGSDSKPKHFLKDLIVLHEYYYGGQRDSYLFVECMYWILATLPLLKSVLVTIPTR